MSDSPAPAAFQLQQAAPALVLASQSSARRDVLRRAGLRFTQRVSGVDEGPDAASGLPPAVIAARLAQAKAIAASSTAADELVIGCDQTLSCAGRLFNKPETLAAARAQLEFLAGKTHRLHSAICLARGGQVVWSHIAEPELHMRALSPGFLDWYIAAEGSAVLSSAGAYRLEGLGVLLFSAITGEHSAILGLPLLPLLAALRAQGVLAG